MTVTGTTRHSAVVTLPSDTEIQIVREFAAPKHLVFRACTEPELIKRWWAGDKGTVTHVEVDLRPGGTWRYVMEANGGFEVAFHGEYSEVVPGERTVSTEIFEGMPDAWSEVTSTLVEQDGRTTMTQRIVVRDLATRDAYLASGMEEGMQGSMDHLEDVAVSLAA